jgi:FlaA1/EpsC-like NDP-sugar epimerase
LNHYLKNKTILVTGGTGSIGRRLVSKILEHQPQSIRILSRDEFKQFQFREQLGADRRVRFLIGDIRDKSRLSMAMEGVDYVFNAAALKQVPLCEFNPFEAVKTNVIGTQNIIEVAMEQRVEKVILISTDKVVNPINTMGTTKLLAERLMNTANNYKGPRPIVFSCVRFGNVAGSRGSVIPLFLTQLMRKQEITITEPEMTRFIMTIDKAVSLVLEAGELATHGETFILKMPCVKLGDLVEVINSTFAAHLGCTPTTVKVIGARSGEKMHEQLVFEHEIPFCSQTDSMLIVGYNKTGTSLDPAIYRSDAAPQLNHQQIHDLLVEINQSPMLLY